MRKQTDRVVSRRVQQALKKHGWTQKDMAAAIGMPEGQFSKHLSGKQRLPLETVQAVAEVLGCSVGELIDAPTGGPVGAFAVIRFLVERGMPGDRAYELALGIPGEPLTQAERDQLRIIGPKLAAESPPRTPAEFEATAEEEMEPDAADADPDEPGE